MGREEAESSGEDTGVTEGYTEVAEVAKEACLHPQALGGWEGGAPQPL